MVLQKIKADAEAKIGETVTEAIITVPAYFNDSQRQATKNAGEIAGLKVSRILNEPTAAAVVYGFNKHQQSKILVYDFGGGTLDVSIIEVVSASGDSFGENINVVATGGDTHLGGDDFDQRLINHILAEYKKESGVDLKEDKLALQRIKDSAEKAKKELSNVSETEINLPFITSTADGPRHLVMKITRSKFNELTKDLIDRSIEKTETTLKEAKLGVNDISDVILVGGTTRIPAIQERIKDYFKKEPKKDINPDEVVAMGAAIVAGSLQGDVKDLLLLDVTPLTLSIETLGGVATPMIPKNTYIPTSKTETFSTASDNQPAVDVHVLQGERPMANDNKTLARFILDGIPPAPRGIPQVEVTFDIDKNGILNVTAKDKATNKTQSVKIEASTDLSKEEIEKMKEEASKFAETDKKQKEFIDLRNQAESLVYQSESSLKDNQDKIPEDLKTKINDKVKVVKDILAKKVDEVTVNENTELLKKGIEDLSQTVSEIGKHIYKDQNTNTDTKTEEDKKPDEKDNVQDANFEEK
jgi:molecular chaperone DnaK